MKQCIKRWVTIRHKDGRATHFPQLPDLKPWSIEDLRDMIDKEAEIVEVDEVSYIELTKEEAASVLATAAINQDKILYNGQWLLLGRTSLTDDVATGSHYSIAEQWRQRMRFGARIDDCYFNIIDQFSDG